MALSYPLNCSEDTFVNNELTNQNRPPTSMDMVNRKHISTNRIKNKACLDDYSKWEKDTRAACLKKISTTDDMPRLQAERIIMWIPGTGSNVKHNNCKTNIVLQ